ncbi:MAG: hypothetical protein ACXW6T_20080 [Candidatus Binatia bacterium]
MALDYGTQRTAQRANVQRPVQTDCRSLIVSETFRFQLVKKPQALLRERQRRRAPLGSAWNGHLRRRATAALLQFQLK